MKSILVKTFFVLLLALALIYGNEEIRVVAIVVSVVSTFVFIFRKLVFAGSNYDYKIFHSDMESSFENFFSLDDSLNKRLQENKK